MAYCQSMSGKDIKKVLFKSRHSGRKIRHCLTAIGYIEFHAAMKHRGRACEFLHTQRDRRENLNRRYHKPGGPPANVGHILDIGLR